MTQSAPSVAVIDNGICNLRSVTKAVQSVDPKAEVSADPVTHKVDVKSNAPRERLTAALTAIGYAPA